MSVAPTPGFGSGWKFTAVFVAGTLIGALSAVQIVPNFAGTATSGEAAALDPGAAPIGGATGLTGGVAATTGADGKVKAGEQVASAAGGGGSTAVAPGRPGLVCNGGDNGGATDTGVTATEIKMATTVAESGIGGAFLGEVRFAMESVKNQVNAAGGVCGRRLAIEYRDDAWDAQRGSQYLRNFIQSGIFAIPVGPSSEGLRVVIDSGDVDRAPVPVVGTDGMLKNQYERADGSAQPWVWPVATATVSSARIMVTEALKRGAKDLSIVFDKNYRFGVEAAQAFNDEVKRRTGKSVDGYNAENICQRRFCGINAGSQSYSQDVATFEPGDFVALFLEPDTARKWMADANTPNPSEIKFGYGAAQPLFTRSFAVNCQDKCHGMQVWTGFKAPIENYKDDPGVVAYVENLQRTKPDADVFNAFTQGGYVGMLLLVDALKAVGPDLTRARLKQVLDSTCLASGLTLQPKICYSPNNRYANVTMQGFVIQHRGTFAGWRSGPIVRDPAS